MSRPYSRSAIALSGGFLLAALSACGSSSPSNVGADAGTDAGSRDVGSTPQDGGTTADGGNASAAVSGLVSLNDSPIANATVAVVGGAVASATTGADGTFSFSLPVGSTQLLRATLAGARASQSSLVVPAEGVTNFKLVLIRAADLTAAYSALSLTEDTTKGIFLLHVRVAGVAGSTQPGGFGATLSVTGGTRFGVSDSGPMRQETTSVGDDSLAIANVPVGNVTVIPVLPSGHTCMPRYGLSFFRVDAQTITEAFFDCT